jgi:hypothetical protein
VGNGEFVEVFVDEVLVLQLVWYGERSGHVGLLVDRGQATFENLEVLALQPELSASGGRRWRG